MDMQTGVRWRGSLAQAQVEAGRGGKPIYIDFWSTGCTGCYWMEKTTFHEPAVIEYLNEHFVGVQLNSSEDADEARARMVPVPPPAAVPVVAWTPTAVVEHHRGGTLRSWVGYLPPDDFIAELELSYALHELRSAHPAVARRRLRSLVERRPDAFTTPEAIYWEGVAAYRERRDKEELWPVWRELVRRFPDSPWTVKTTLLIEDGPTHRQR